MKPMKILGIIVLVVILLVSTGCVMTSSESSVGATQTVQLAVKDFVVVGRIRYEVQSKTANKEENLISYDQLLQKAYALGADDVINVRVDKRRKTTLPRGNSPLRTYVVNALAIKYTNAVPGGGVSHWEVNALSAER